MVTSQHPILSSYGGPILLDLGLNCWVAREHRDDMAVDETKFIIEREGWTAGGRRGE